MSMHPIDALILARLYDRPNWARSLQKVKGRLSQLVDAGYAERITPSGEINGRNRNMVRLTPRGHDAIEKHWQHDAERGAHSA